MPKKYPFQRTTLPPPPTEKSTKYDRYVSIKTFDGKDTYQPLPANETLMQCLERFGYKITNMEGGSGPEHHQTYKSVFAENPWIRTVCEVGFNYGASAQMFMDLLYQYKNTNDYVHLDSFDIILHPYSAIANLYMQYKYRSEFKLHVGDSGVSIPDFGEQIYIGESYTYDMIFIDGGHDEAKAYADIFNLRPFAHPRTIVIIDNVIPGVGRGDGVYKAAKRAIEEGMILFDKHIEIGDYKDGQMICRYAFPPTADGKEVSAPGKKPDYAYMERRVKLIELSRKMREAATVTQLNKLYKEAKEEERRTNQVDKYLEKDYQIRLKELKRRGGKK